MREHAMLVRAPLRELRQILEHPRARGVEDMRAVAVYEDACVVVVVVGVPADVSALVADDDALPARGEALCADAPGEARADDQEVEHAEASSARARSSMTS